MDQMRMFSLFNDSNVEAFDQRDDRYPAVLEAGLTKHGLDFNDVLAVTRGFGFWAICKQGIFHARLKGMFSKQPDVDDLIPYSQILEARVEQIFRPEGAKIVLYDNSEKKFAQIEFIPSGGRSSTTSQDELAQCQRILQIIEGAWRAAGAA
jgi:hypothetical protein